MTASRLRPVTFRQIGYPLLRPSAKLATPFPRPSTMRTSTPCRHDPVLSAFVFSLNGTCVIRGGSLISRCLRGGQIAGQRLRQTVDQGEHVGVLLRVPAGEQVR
jgi:hypothetical protein